MASDARRAGQPDAVRQGSLDAGSDLDDRWNALAATRDAEADADPASLVTGPEALARIRASLG